ncbi:hypothetical protein SH668x_003303 [Planctomicrobium sp. SH668]|uniref:hypothetical protein n=1 Tax=Planctomicrobium sp. SH668 TaxID=3448126 RepID=UPI003F5C92C9
MGKLSLAGTSLTAAIPAGALAYVLLMAVLQSLDKMSTTLKIAVIATLLVSAIVAILPAYLLIWYRRDPVVRDKKAKTKGKPEAAAAVAGDELTGDDLTGELPADGMDLTEEFPSETLSQDEAFEEDVTGAYGETAQEFDMSGIEDEFSPEGEFDQDREATLEFDAHDEDDFASASNVEDDFTFDEFMDEDEDDKKK